MWRSYDEGKNKQELMAIVEDMALLDNRYPELSTPRRVREMTNNGNFSIDDRP